LHNKRHPKNLIIVRVVATVLVLLSLILPYFSLIAHSITPYVILITLFAFFIVENKNNKKVVSE